MKHSKTLRSSLFVAGMIAISIGTTILLAPVPFHATHGIELGVDASLLSEIRAPGGALMTLGVVMLVGVFVASFVHVATTVGISVYLSYGLSRLLSLGLDGKPDPGLLAAAAIELAIGSALLAASVRSRRRREAATHRALSDAEC